MFGVDDMAIAMMANMGAGLLSGGGSQQARDSTMVLPEQRALLQEMLAKYYSGQGDFGQAGAMREGRDTLYNEAAAAGVPIQSGNVQAGLASKFGEAAKQSGLQRMLYGLQLAQASPAFANTGENYGYPQRRDIAQEGRTSLTRYSNPQAGSTSSATYGGKQRRANGKPNYGF